MSESKHKQEDLELAQYHPSPPSSDCDEEIAVTKDISDKPVCATTVITDSWWDSAAWKRFLELNYSSDGEANVGGSMLHLKADEDAQPMAAGVRSPAETKVDAVHIRRRNDGLSSASRSIIIGLEVPRDLPSLPSSSQKSGGSDALSQMLNAYLAKLSPKASADAGRLLPKTFEPGKMSRATSGNRSSGPRPSNQGSEQPRPRCQEHHANDYELASSDSTLERTIDDLIATDMLISRRNQNQTEGVESDMEGHQETSKDITPLVEQLQHIGTHNRAVWRNSNEPESQLAAHLSKAWIRARLQEKWQREFKPALSKQLSVLSAEHLRNVTSDLPSTTCAASEKQLSRQRRLLTREAKSACKQSQLHETSSALHSTLLTPLHDLEALYDFQAAQTLLLLQPHLTLPELLHPLTTTQQSLSKTALLELPLLESKVSALTSLLEIVQRTCAALETRINRLSAKDVPAGPDRERTKCDRLVKPEALTYVVRVGMDVAFVRESAGVVLRGLEDVERDLAGFAKKGARVWRGWREAEGFVEGL